MGHAHNHSHNYTELCTEALKRNGSRVTQARLAVIHCLASADRPLTPREIVELIEKDKALNSIDKVSVYRVLEKLLELELVHQVGPQGGYLACNHVECEVALHLMTQCMRCGEAVEQDVPEDVLAPVRWYLADSIGFTPGEHLLHIKGICRSCSSRANAK